MNTGQFNRRILIQAPSTTQDDAGQPINTWTDVVNTWANIRTASSKEVYVAQGFVSVLTHVITIRYNPSIAISVDMRVVYCDRVFLIQAVNDPDESRVVRQLLCKEVDTNA